MKQETFPVTANVSTDAATASQITANHGTCDVYIVTDSFWDVSGEEITRNIEFLELRQVNKSRGQCTGQ